MPHTYGIPKNTKGLLDWTHVRERMSNARVYWLCTSSPDSRPHAMPEEIISRAQSPAPHFFLMLLPHRRPDVSPPRTGTNPQSASGTAPTLAPGA